MRLAESSRMTPLTPYLHHKVVVLHFDASAEQAAKAMEAHSIGYVVISDHDGHIIGVVTDRDIACRLVAHGKSGDQPLSSFMTRQPATAGEGDTLAMVVRL